ncbi:hypothetical protein [Reyranella sp.]|uniref:hypothetical protein n=1 Tax=Reyranella sp. TaxID=1929291 RepID=UPI003D14559D
MSTFEDCYVYPEEGWWGRFAHFAARPEANHVMKRSRHSYRWLHEIPDSIGMVYMLRDPRDVLTSSWGDIENYIDIERWNVEMDALLGLLKSNRPNMVVVRFEDLASRPQDVQSTLAEKFRLKPRARAQDFASVFEVQDKNTTISAMHGLRPPDPSAIGRWRRSDESRLHLAALREAVLSKFQPLASRFEYDLSDWPTQDAPVIPSEDHPPIPFDQCFDRGIGTPLRDPRAHIRRTTTKLSMEFHCACGAECSFEGTEAYVVVCPHCQTAWEMPCTLFPRKVDGRTNRSYVAKSLTPDENYRDRQGRAIPVERSDEQATANVKSEG